MRKEREFSIFNFTVAVRNEIHTHFRKELFAHSVFFLPGTPRGVIFTGLNDVNCV